MTSLVVFELDRRDAINRALASPNRHVGLHTAVSDLASDVFTAHAEGSADFRGGHFCVSPVHARKVSAHFSSMSVGTTICCSILLWIISRM